MNRTSFNLLIAGGGDDLYEHLKKFENRFVYLGYDPMTASYYSMQHPSYENESPCVKILFKGINEKFAGGLRSLSIPWKFLTEPVDNNWVYRITFGPSSDEDKVILSHKSFDAFRIGYIGMTSRTSPFLRFDEHFQKSRRGEGHLLHKAWSAIASQAGVIVQFSIIGCADSRAKAFDVEEYFVDEVGSMSPNGLNVLAGGMKGIREMWRLGLMAKSLKPTDANRDAALALLETNRSPVAAHYRTGHIRKLPTKCRAETTWVSPCWVGLKEVSA